MKGFFRAVFLFSLAGILVSLTHDTDLQFRVAPAASGVCTGDVDLDGDQDILVGHHYDQAINWAGISMLENSGSGIYSIDSAYLNGEHENVLLQNLDTNQLPDLVTEYSDGISAFIGVVLNWDINRSNVDMYPVPSNVTRIKCGDIDGDGKADIVFICNNDKLWGVMYNNGFGHFGQTVITHLSYAPQDISTGDLNNDGREDVAICGQSIEVYFSLPAGFQKVVVDQSDFRHRIRITDFDLDGMPDLFTSEDIYGIITYYNVFQNNGNSSFTKLPDHNHQPGALELLITDFNNDQLPDVMFALDNNTGHWIYYNQGNFQVADSQFVAIPDYGEVWRNCACADFDNNGYNDIVTTRYTHLELPANVDIRYNDGLGHFGPDPIVGVHSPGGKDSQQLACFPNPAHEKATIRYHLDRISKVEITIVDVNGNITARLVEGFMERGMHLVRWDGRNQKCDRCCPGIYIVTLVIDGLSPKTTKLILCENEK